MTVEPLTSRGTSVCRGCGSTGLESVLDLGDQPLANEMAARAEDVLDTFPLHLRICAWCGLGQLGEYVLPDRIFGDDYPYLSSTSQSWVAHAREYASAMTEVVGLSHDSLVVEVASNDGYLLAEFQRHGIPVLGVEPASGVGDLARARGIPTMQAFFGASVAAGILDEHPHPALVTANNVMAHVPDLDDFIEGIATLCGPATLVTVENPSLVSLLAGNQFDTIYHEHFSYLTAHAVRAAVRPHGLELVRVDSLATHGGSNRYWMRRAGTSPIHESVDRTLESETEGGLFDQAEWSRFAGASGRAVAGLRDWLLARSSDGRRVAVYGAAAKMNTFLNAVGPAASTIAFAVDGSAHKQGRFLPGSRIPVLEPTHLSVDQPDDVLIGPWNLADEIASLVHGLAPKSTIWVALPEMRAVR